MRRWAKERGSVWIAVSVALAGAVSLVTSAWLGRASSTLSPVASYTIDMVGVFGAALASRTIWSRVLCAFGSGTVAVFFAAGIVLCAFKGETVDAAVAASGACLFGGIAATLSTSAART